METDHPGLCSHCRGFLVQWEATWRFDREGHFIGSYRIRLGCCVENILNFRLCLLRLGAYSVLVPGLENVYIIIRLNSARFGIFLGKYQ